MLPIHPRTLNADTDSYTVIGSTAWDSFLGLLGLDKATAFVSSLRKPSNVLTAIVAVGAMTTIFTGGGIAGIQPAQAAEEVSQVAPDAPEAFQALPESPPVAFDLPESASLGASHPVIAGAPAGTSLGVDVGSSQKSMNLSTFGDEGGGFTIVKQGGANVSEGLYVAPHYKSQVAAARKAGLPVGHYWFNGQSASIAEQAQFFMDTAQVEPGDIIALDIEAEARTNTRDFNPDEAAAWIEGIRKKFTDVKVFLYMNVSTMNSADWSQLTDNPLWIASFGKSNGDMGRAPAISHWSDWTIWQYSDTAQVPGFGGAIDANVAKLDLFSSYGWQPNSAE